MAVVQDHNKVDPQGPTKTDLPAPVFFPAQFHRRASYSNHLHLPLIPVPFYPHFYCQPLSWPSFYHKMARPRRSEQRDDKVQPPRPPNAWILYRSHQFKLLRRNNNERLSQASVSKIIADMWKRESEEVRQHFERQAEAKKAEHQELYPDYCFCPKRRETKRSRKKPKCRDATPADAVEDDDHNAPPPVPVFPIIPYAHQPQPQAQPSLVPGYYYNMAMPQPFIIPYIPEAHSGSGGPSPPLSSAPSPSPVPYVGSELSPRSQPAPSSSSTPSIQSSSMSRPSSSSSQLPTDAICQPSLPDSHHPPPNPYATLPLSALLFQNSMPGELPPASPQLQLQSAENTVNPAAPAWTSIPTYLPSPDPQNSHEVVNLSLPIHQTQTFTEFQQSIPSSSSFESLQGLLSRTDESGVFNLSNIESSALLTYPQGDLEVAMGPQASMVGYCEDLFTEFDIIEFQRQIDSLREGGSSSPPITGCSIPDDLRSLFHTPNNYDPQVSIAPQQRQPSAFTQDMMNFLNFEAAEELIEDHVPITTVAPEQVRPQSSQVAPAMPIFTQMTNTPTVTSGTSYVPPAGAIYSSTRRVAGSWKSPFTISYPQMDESILSWSLSTTN